MAAKQKSTQEAYRKWLQKAAAPASAYRPILTYGHVTNGATVTTDGFRLHLVFDELPNKDGFIDFGVGVEASGRYPDVWSVIPTAKHALFEAVVDARQFTAAVKRAAVFARDNANVLYLTFTSEYNRLYVAARSEERGDTQTVLQARYSEMTAEQTFAYNYQFILDALSAFEGEVTLRAWKDGKLVIGDMNKQFAFIMPMGFDYHKAKLVAIDRTLEPCPIGFKYPKWYKAKPRAAKSKLVPTLEHADECEFTVATINPTYGKSFIVVSFPTKC